VVVAPGAGIVLHGGGRVAFSVIGFAVALETAAGGAVFGGLLGGNVEGSCMGSDGGVGSSLVCRVCVGDGFSGNGAG